MSTKPLKTLSSFSAFSWFVWSSPYASSALTPLTHCDDMLSVDAEPILTEFVVLCKKNAGDLWTDVSFHNFFLHLSFNANTPKSKHQPDYNKQKSQTKKQHLTHHFSVPDCSLFKNKYFLIFETYRNNMFYKLFRDALKVFKIFWQ